MGYFMTGFIAASLVLTSISGSPGVTAEAALSKIQVGNQRYVSGQMQWQGQDLARRSLVAAGQSPHTIVLTCADSRVSPEILFDQGLGDLFVIRVAGNILDTNSVASIEYAAEHLHSPLLLVMGHERCGAVAATLDVFKQRVNGQANGHADDDHKNISALVQQLMPAVRGVAGDEGDFLANAIQKNVELTIHDCVKRSPMLSKMVAAGSFKIVGGVYDLDSGKVEFLTGHGSSKHSDSGHNAEKSFVKIHPDH